MNDNPTQDYYNQNYQTLITQYDQATLTSLHHLFAQHIHQGDTVLDIGFGSGRDLRTIRSLGAEVYGVERSQGFIDHLRQESYFQNRLFYAQLPHLGLDFGFKFDVIVCIAVIMHLSREQIKAWVEDIPNYLAEGGRVIVSYSVTPREGDVRFFEDFRGDVVQQIFLESGFRLVDEVGSEDGLSRGIEWWSEVYGVG